VLQEKVGLWRERILFLDLLLRERGNIFEPGSECGFENAL